MPTAKTPEDKKKLAKVYKICNGLQKKNHMSDKSKESCVIGIAKRWRIGKARKKK